MDMSKKWIKKYYFRNVYIGYLLEDGKGGDRKQDGKMAYWNYGRMWSMRRRLDGQTCW
jgi:hypothetical protein